MMNRQRWRPAFAIVAAAAGTGFASGREIVWFFSQTGRAAWAGIPFACLIFALLTGLTARAAVRHDALSFPDLCRRMLGRRTAQVACALYALLLAVAFMVMLRRAGETAAIALPLEHAFLWGLTFALLAALLINGNGLRALPLLGLPVVALGMLFYAALALDAGPVRVYVRGDASLALEDSVPAALLLALSYSAMNACLAAGAAARFGRLSDSPAALGARCGALLCALLLCANAAIARGGRALLIQALPTVLLAARWGLTGFWICAGFGYLCAVATLTAALGGLIDLMRAMACRMGC